ncbi:hypothetical protein [Microbacterium kyungheense]|uniref:Uncharacterized protein n=1 Tax=Microbacterium kyungheense TaxID=1263636 RepID=A0A543EU46_9MICO|nr:hypothetical protein [Microbacterium kyungheense]TQM25105.1 hypothetical protein FB391_2564 [Microbacterium kyungheense]
MMYLQCGACGSIVHVPAGQTPEQASSEHIQAHDASELRGWSA